MNCWIDLIIDALLFCVYVGPGSILRPLAAELKPLELRY